MRGVGAVEVVDDGVDHDGLLVDCEGRVGGDCHPVVCGGLGVSGS